jgi:hypothetical protein
MSKNEKRGYGDIRTPPPNKAFRDNFDSIFRKCRTHPTYQGVRAPTADCETCRQIFKDNQKAGS